MNAALIVTIVITISGLVLGLVQFIVNNLIKKLDELSTVIKEMSSKFEQYVKVQDHKEDVFELRKRIDKLEDGNIEDNKYRRILDNMRDNKEK